MFFRFFLICLFCATSALGARADETFAKVTQIFSKHCVRCHNEATAKGDFSLSTREAFSESGMVDPGDESSHLLTLLTGPDQSMPKEAAPLSESDVQIIRRWIVDGAKWTDGTVIA